jgi:hypothetical protein
MYSPLIKSQNIVTTTQSMNSSTVTLGFPGIDQTQVTINPLEKYAMEKVFFELARQQMLKKDLDRNNLILKTTDGMIKTASDQSNNNLDLLNKAKENESIMLQKIDNISNNNIINKKNGDAKIKQATDIVNKALTDYNIKNQSAFSKETILIRTYKKIPNGKKLLDAATADRIKTLKDTLEANKSATSNLNSVRSEINNINNKGAADLESANKELAKLKELTDTASNNYNKSVDSLTYLTAVKKNLEDLAAQIENEEKSRKSNEQYAKEQIEKERLAAEQSLLQAEKAAAERVRIAREEQLRLIAETDAKEAERIRIIAEQVNKQQMVDETLKSNAMKINTIPSTQFSGNLQPNLYYNNSYLVKSMDINNNPMEPISINSGNILLNPINAPVKKNQVEIIPMAYMGEIGYNQAAPISVNNATLVMNDNLIKKDQIELKPISYMGEVGKYQPGPVYVNNAALSSDIVNKPVQYSTYVDYNLENKIVSDLVNKPVNLPMNDIVYTDNLSQEERNCKCKTVNDRISCVCVVNNTVLQNMPVEQLKQAMPVEQLKQPTQIKTLEGFGNKNNRWIIYVILLIILIIIIMKCNK